MDFRWPNLCIEVGKERERQIVQIWNCGIWGMGGLWHTTLRQRRFVRLALIVGELWKRYRMGQTGEHLCEGIGLLRTLVVGTSQYGNGLL